MGNKCLCKKNILRAALLLLFFAMLCAGLLFDEVAAVYGRGIRICMECIGIG